MGYTGPIEGVIDALQDGGNFASHFETGRTITPAIAGHVLDMLDAWIEYVYLIPQKVSQTAEVLSDPDSYTGQPGEPSDAEASLEERMKALGEAIERDSPGVWYVTPGPDGNPTIASRDFVRPTDEQLNELQQMAADHGLAGIRIVDPHRGTILRERAS